MMTRDSIVRETPLPGDVETQDITLRLDCWNPETGSPVSAAHTDQYNNYVWQEMVELAMKTLTRTRLGSSQAGRNDE